MQALHRIISAGSVAALVTALASAVRAQNPPSPRDPRARAGDTLPLPPLIAMPREQQIQLAMSAAPPQVSEHATVYVLTSRGYIKAREGTNGFSCLVERQFMGTLEPLCYDAEGSATTLQARLYREELRA